VKITKEKELQKTKESASDIFFLKKDLKPDIQGIFL
jgi:hypothetical protein